MTDALLTASGLTKSFSKSGADLKILKGVDLQIREGDALCIVGASGAGKSTLLNILGTLDRPDRGTLSYQGEDLLALGDGQLARFRNREMGFVFQFHHLLGEFTAVENVMMPAQLVASGKKNVRSHALDLLGFLGLSGRTDHYPSEMSGGERQRVAIARALMQGPTILFADEPTGNLDSKNSELIEDYFFKLKQELGLTLVVVTHNEAFARKFDNRRLMIDGQWA